MTSIDPSHAETILEDLDQHSRDLLQYIVAQTDSAEWVAMPEVIEQTGVQSRKAHYRLNKYLEAHGLVETEQPQGTPGDMPPKRIWATERGETIVTEHLANEPERSSHPSEQLDSLQATIDQLDERVKRLEHESGSGVTSDELAGVQQDIQTLKQTVASLQRDPILSDTEAREVMDVGTVWAGVCKDLLAEEHGRDTLMQRFKEKEADLALIERGRN